MRLALVLAPLLLLVACDKKGEPAPATAGSTSVAPSASTSATPGASASAAGSGPASAAGACALLAKEKVDRCNKLSGGDPTILTACREAIDAMVKGADDVKCQKAMEPTKPDEGPDPD